MINQAELPEVSGYCTGFISVDYTLSKYKTGCEVRLKHYLKQYSLAHMWACHDRHLTFAINSATIKINDEKEKESYDFLLSLG